MNGCGYRELGGEQKLRLVLTVAVELYADRLAKDAGLPNGIGLKHTSKLRREFRNDNEASHFATAALASGK